MIKKMDKSIFMKHLEMTVEEIKRKEGLVFLNDTFIINPVYEKEKPLTARDEMMRLNILNKNRIENRTFNKEEVVSMLTFFTPFVPVWIDVEYDGQACVFQIRCSLRLRKPSLLRNQESGHPPFRAVLKDS